MATALQGKRVAAIVAAGFEQIKLLEPKDTLEAPGAKVEVISPEDGTVRGWNHTDWGNKITVDRPLDQARPDEYDALLLPGGVMNPDRLRTNEKAIRFIRQMFDAGKPIAAICHGPWALIEAGVVRGLQMTSYPSIKTDLKNAGATWVDREVVVDRGRRVVEAPGRHPRVHSEDDRRVQGIRHGGAGRRESARAR